MACENIFPTLLYPALFNRNNRFSSELKVNMPINWVSRALAVNMDVFACINIQWLHVTLYFEVRMICVRGSFLNLFSQSISKFFVIFLDVAGSDIFVNLKILSFDS